MNITLKTLAQVSDQEVFDFVAKHLLTQNKAARAGPREDFDEPRYHYGELKCAAGCLIADEEYSPRFERKSWRQLVSTGKVPKEHVDLIAALQKVHDASNFLMWKTKLKELAISRSLNFEVLNHDYSGNAVSSNKTTSVRSSRPTPSKPKQS